MFKYLIAIIFILISLLGNSFASDTGSQEKSETKFGKIFEIFISNKYADSDEKNKLCQFYKENPLSKKSLIKIGDILYFGFFNFGILGGYLSYFFLSFMKIKREIEGNEEEDKDSRGIKFLPYFIKEKGIQAIGITLLFLFLYILIGSFLTIKC